MAPADSIDQTTLSLHTATKGRLEAARIARQTETGKIIKSWDEIIDVLIENYMKGRR